jgi:hypothetical protein
MQTIPSRTIIVQDNSMALVLPAIVKIIQDKSLSIKELNLVKPEETQVLKESKKLLINEDRYMDLQRMGKKRRTQEEEAEYLELSQDKYDDYLTKAPDYALDSFRSNTKEQLAKFRNGGINTKSELIDSIRLYKLEQQLTAIQDSTDTVEQKYNLINPDEPQKSQYRLDRVKLFKEIKLNTKMVAQGDSTAFLLTGMGGLGKTFNVEDVIDKLGMVKGQDWFSLAGVGGVPGLYQELYKNNGKLTVIDDFDSVLTNEDAVNILKAALDTKQVRTISYKKDGYFDPRGMSSEEIQDGLIDKNGKERFPSNFDFDGGVIFISNWDMDDIPQPLKTRCLKLDLQLTTEEVSDHIRSLLPFIKPTKGEYSMELKEHMLKLLNELTIEGEIKYMTVRDFVVGLPKFKCWTTDEMNYSDHDLKGYLLFTVVEPAQKGGKKKKK